ncbi:MAG: PEPxxWA-CTERM sorting domain-containing protein [Pseudomonadota bacterium]
MRIVAAFAIFVSANVAFMGTALAQYNFDVLYTGSGNATLALGSDNPLVTLLNSGDSFAYSLTATGGSYWQVNSATPLFAALQVSPSGTTIVDFAYSLFLDGGQVFSGSQNDVSNCCIHLGESAFLTSGLVFDQLTFTVSLESGVGRTPVSLLPFAGAPEQTQSGIAFVNSVPEPSTWAMMLMGFAMVGGAMRRRLRRQLQATPSLA